MTFNTEHPTNRKDNSIPGIYKLVDRTNGKIYIGSAQSLHARFRYYQSIDHNPAKAKRKVEYAIRKRGFVSFDFEVVELVKDKTMLIPREQHWIDALRPHDDSVGYNINSTAQSPLGVKRTPEQRKRMSEAGKRRNPSTAALDTYRANMSDDEKEANRAKLKYWRDKNVEKMRVQYGRPVYQIDKIALKIVGEFRSANFAGQCMGATLGSGIKRACQRKRPSAYGYYWCYKDEYDKMGFEPPIYERIQK